MARAPRLYRLFFCNNYSSYFIRISLVFTSCPSSVAEFYPRYCITFIFSYILFILLLHLSHFFPPLYSPLPYIPPPPTIIPHLSSCLCVIHISSLASLFLILFLTSPCLLCTYNLCFLFPVPFPPFSLLHLPADNPPCDLHFCESVPVLVVGLVHFWF